MGAALSVAGVDVAVGGQQHFANLGVPFIGRIMQRGCLTDRAQRKERTLFQTQTEVGAALLVPCVDVAIGGQQHFANLKVPILGRIV